MKMAPLIRQVKVPFEMLNATEARLLNDQNIKPSIVYLEQPFKQRYFITRYCYNGIKVVNVCEVYINTLSIDSDEVAISKAIKEAPQYVKLGMRNYFGSKIINDRCKCTDDEILVVI